MQLSEPGPETPVAPVPLRSAALSLLTVLALLFLLRYAQALFVPLALAILIAYALDPFVTQIARLRLPRPMAAAIVLLALLGTASYGVYALRLEFMGALESLPEVAQEMRKRVRQMQEGAGETSPIGKIKEAAAEIEKAATEVAASKGASRRGVTKVQIEEPAFEANQYLWSGSMGLLGLLSQTVLVLFLVFFLLSSGDLFKRKFVRIVGNRLSEKRVTLEALNEINAQIERFLLAQVCTSVLVAICTAVTLWAFGVNQPAIWGAAAGLFNSIPYFGALLVTGGLALVTFVQFGTMAAALQVAGAALLITSLEGLLLTPALMGRVARINGVAMFVSLLFWGWLWGIIGMIVAVPIMMVVKSVCDRIEGLQPIGELLGDR
jgi:predicted PurR-regulated permease PerM